MGFQSDLLILTADDAAYEIEQSLRFNSADSAYLSRTHSAGNQKLWTWSAWVKRGKIGTSGYLFFTRWASGNSQGGVFFAGDTLRYFARVSGSDKAEVYTTSVFRDPSAWYHVVAVLDAANTSFKFYVNNVEQPLTTVTAVQNADHAINHAEEHNLGNEPTQSGYFDGYMAEVHFVEGSALDPTSFGELDNNGVWRPIKYAGSYTSNSFYLKFDAADVGGDSSGLGNDWTPSPGISTSGTGTDVMSDTPTTNYATLNPLDNGGNTVSNGNLVVNTSAGFDLIRSTFFLSSGKWYWEVTADDGGEGYVGISSAAESLSSRGAETANSATIRTTNGNIRTSASDSAYGSAVSDGDVMMLALDMDAGKFWAGKNGTWFNSGDPAAGTNAGKTGLTVPVSPSISVYDNEDYTANFGQRAFAYTPPTGFKALNTDNLPAPDIKDGSDYFQTVLWTGNSTDDRNITVADNSGNTWQPDLVWIKARITASLHQHELYDAVRGATKRLQSNDPAIEDTAANNMQAFNPDGFQVGTASSVNASSDGYVAWNWLAGGSGSTNTDGSINSTVSANPSAGFSIVTFNKSTANTVTSTFGHGLGVAPKMIIAKHRDQSDNWRVYTETTGASARLVLNSADAVITPTNTWGNTAPTSTVFSMEGVLTGEYVAYCFAEVEGYSKIGSYTGNGSSDGPFVFCGFKPAIIILKKTTNDGANRNWYILDDKRPEYNPVGEELYPNLADATPGNFSLFDFNSNGFKLRNNGDSLNGSTKNYVFIAFASNPFGGSGVSPATAR
jgi:hypothetical protein